VAAELAAHSKELHVETRKRVAAKIAACWKWFGSKNSSLFKECKGVAAELAAC
jgi:hypothetical protein